MRASALTDIRTPDLRRFLAQEATHRPAPSSQSRTVAALRCFFRFCVESDYLERDPAHVLRTPKKREALPDVLDRGELARLLDAPGKDGVWKRLHAGKVQRDRLLLALFSYGGLRRSELLCLDVDDVDLDRRLVRVRNAKGGRQRVVPIHPGLVPLFVAYEAVRPQTSDRALFLGVHGRRLTPANMALTFRRYATAAGVNKRKRITPHTLRHVFVSQADFDGGSVPRFRPRGRRAFCDAKSEEVPRGAAGAWCSAGVRVGTADRARRA